MWRLQNEARTAPDDTGHAAAPENAPHGNALA
jgi:hypothetical protein